ncbi:amino acid ABC transporter permease [Brenneria goodwinii]|uniref:Putative glutamine transport system permease protein GlnP n=1 Tax=Brenneria goodwinii TaxID=1109412 RepID=A0A0G4K298_9GAMM|nr:amino acid ABC transporter permease [Brenneria goodwinii]MCG8158070.1 amino acid ABC transporter permease [Brenneria goodwinii]MCG8162411.1 amino acid ABC transporter permease [Brenneria goodwinii]MCG8167121.1 amino acid ABC transporter permease [Brenneria goodwinii]MCG8171781.1 amino acid ABC transporter permease [Brenneria goodwinii]MCG8176587.1 amino acid ABC transporter permease [Brenneria goodwinii]
MMSIDLNYGVVLSKLPLLLDGCVVTLQVSACALLLGMASGIVGALCRLSRNPLLRWPAFLYVWVVRGTPFLVQLFILYFGLAAIGLPMGSMEAGIIGLGVNAGAYITEIIRGGIQSVDRGQSEAAASLGMNGGQSMFHIIAPQAIKFCVPALVNQFIMTLKNSSIVSLVTIAELFHVADRINSATFRSFEVYTTVAALYLIMNTFFMLIAAWLEKRMARS